MVQVDLIDVRSGRDAEGWNAYVRAHPSGTPFHLTHWAQAINDAYGYETPYLRARRGQEVVGVLPLTHVRSALFGKSLISNAFAVYGGPLADDAEAHAALDAEAWVLAQKFGVPALEYRNQERLRPDWAAKAETYVTFRRPLAVSEDDNLKAIPRKQRAEVRRSLGFDLETLIDRNVDRHFAVYAESVRNLGTPVFPKRWFAALLNAYGPDADILTVARDGKPLSSVLSLYFNGEVAPYYGGGVEAARTWRANDHMYWKLMLHAVERGCDRFDFGRSKVGTGAFSFKKNWGFEPTPLVYEYRLADGHAMPDLNPLNPKYKLMTEVWSRLPLPVANTLGPLIARGLA
ncbi:FemAB family XrtA/PEP-CTERM system-associated protein [Pedomonas mirosovicensis]|uniref:FemAB family XrtA/PEP-CTERM system-associated protein n=1 Tax=Pedomonas mirosovicensis TaxID=2908641 RepID=UPI0021690921|nr:FemAB family XrtA/PEP-CTERM system-associated protein [Pedomonas mirosovicensis]MCH8684321.1 FemAB family PEP-CTERM system-associated protein [Pedomonas mirosovicensis]